MYEHRSKPLISRGEFLRRVFRHGLTAFAVLFVALGIGIVGYKSFEPMSWIDATLNASMILGGMGPVDTMTTVHGKLFASAYALFSGVLFIALMGFMIAPFAHRLMHRFHIEDDAEGNEDSAD